MFEEGWLFLVDKEIIKIIYYSYLNIIQTFFKNSENEKINYYFLLKLLNEKEGNSEIFDWDW